MKYPGLLFPDTETLFIKAIKSIVADKGVLDVYVGRKRLSPQDTQQNRNQVVIFSSSGDEIIAGTRKQDLVTVNVYSKDYTNGSYIIRMLSAELQNFYSNKIEQVIINGTPNRVAYEGEEEFFTVKFFVWILPED